MKKERQNAIIAIISQMNIETQEELTAELVRRGFAVTQSTVSRDIKELKIVKISFDGDRYKYSVKTSDPADSGAKYRTILSETVVSVQYAGNLMVIKTYPGMANAAAAAIDTICQNEILGSIAGDDTIIAVLHTEQEASEMQQKLSGMLRY